MGTSVCSPALSRINKRSSSSSSRFLSLSIRPTTILASLPSPQPAAVPERPSAIDMVVGEAELVSAPPAHRSRHPFLVWCGIAASSFCFSFGMEEWWLRLVWWIVSFLPGTFASFFFPAVEVEKGAAAFFLLPSPSGNFLLLRFLQAPNQIPRAPSPAAGEVSVPGTGEKGEEARNPFFFFCFHSTPCSFRQAVEWGIQPDMFDFFSFFSFRIYSRQPYLGGTGRSLSLRDSMHLVQDVLFPATYWVGRVD